METIGGSAMKAFIESMTEKIIKGGEISVTDAEKLAEVKGIDIYTLFLNAAYLKEYFLGPEISLCTIINAKSGRCPENCSFCSQSSHHTSDAPIYPLVDEETIVAGAKEAEKNNSTCFGIVTSGTSISKGKELDTICNALRKIRQETSIHPSCSLGIIDYETAQALREAGMTTYHHNLETSRSFFPVVCTTHDYDEDIETIRAAKKTGARVCCGGIFGLGESMDQRIELAFTLKELDVDSVPINFLNPIPGTRLERANFLTPMQALKTIALFRFILPDKKIAICGGRDINLRDLQSWIFLAGASGTMVGNYLTTTGRPMEDDWQMLIDLDVTLGECGD